MPQRGVAYAGQVLLAEMQIVEQVGDEALRTGRRARAYGSITGRPGMAGGGRLILCAALDGKLRDLVRPASIEQPEVLTREIPDGPPGVIARHDGH
jgi:hypothetical protein